MSGEPTPEALMAKAVRAGVSARVLLELDDVDGACNRADYAMFDAARAALLASGALVQPHGIKTHGGLIAAFGLHLVKNGPISRVGFRRTTKNSRIVRGVCTCVSRGLAAFGRSLGSTDATARIARKQGARVVGHLYNL